MFCTLVDLLEILKLVAQPLVGSARLLLTVVVFYLLASRDTGSVSDFTCHPETTDWATQECFSTYSAEMSSFMHPQFFVIITAVVLFLFWGVMILYSYRKIEKIRRASATAITKMKYEFWGKVLLHVRCEAVFIIVSLGLFVCTQKIILAETYNCIPRNAPVEIVLTCRHKRQQDKKDLNIYFIGGMLSILVCCMLVICRAKKCEVYFIDMVDLTVAKSEAGYDGNQRRETPILNDVGSCSFAVTTDQRGDEQQGYDGSYRRETPKLNADVVSSSSSRASDQIDYEQQVIQRTGAVKRVSKTLADLVYDPSGSWDEICSCLDTHFPGCGDYKDVALCFGYSLFEVKSILKTSPDGPFKALILNVMARQPDVTVEVFAKVVENLTRREDVARLLRKFDRN